MEREKCLGFNQNKKIEVGEFKERQRVNELLSLQEEWVRLKVKIVNSNIDKDDFNQKFHDICFDFDSDYFQQILKEKGFAWPNTLEERFKVILQVAREKLL